MTREVTRLETGDIISGNLVCRTSVGDNLVIVDVASPEIPCDAGSPGDHNGAGPEPADGLGDLGTDQLGYSTNAA